MPAAAVLPKLLSTIVRSLTSTVPSPVNSPWLHAMPVRPKLVSTIVRSFDVHRAVAVGVAWQGCHQRNLSQRVKLRDIPGVTGGQFADDLGELTGEADARPIEQLEGVAQQAGRIDSLRSAQPQVAAERDGDARGKGNGRAPRVAVKLEQERHLHTRRPSLDAHPANDVNGEAVIADGQTGGARVQVQPLDRAVGKDGVGGGGRAEDSPLYPAEIGPRQVSAGQGGVRKDCAGQVLARKVPACQVVAGQVDALQIVVLVAGGAIDLAAETGSVSTNEAPSIVASAMVALLMLTQ